MKDRLGIIFAIFGLILMVLGIVRGEAIMVLQKAILICLECIGIG